MIKHVMNWMTVAMIACLAVTAVFAACDETNGSGNDGGKIDKKLIGVTWVYYGLGYSYLYQFHKDGSFEYFYTTGSVSPKR